MKTFLLSLVALAVVAAPVFGEDQDEHKQSKNHSTNAPSAPQRKTYTPPQPRVNLGAAHGLAKGAAEFLGQ